MKIIRFKEKNSKKVQVGAVTEKEEIFGLPFESVLQLFQKAESENTEPFHFIQEIIKEKSPISSSLKNVELLVPIEISEVWASGVTYQKSWEARNYEATEGKLDANTFYDKVYDAKRPEIFLKATGQRTVGPNDEVYLRSDSNWQVPEPELGLVLNRRGKVIGYTIGNDMSCRDIEGENPLYLPQAKIWKNSCSVGPAIRLVETVEDPYEFQINCRIIRDGEKVFEDYAKVNQLKRTLNELVDYLKKDNEIFDGTVLLTGTCIVPPNNFTLKQGDTIEIEILGIGTLSNLVKQPCGELTISYK